MIVGKVYIKGLKEPIEVTQEQGIKAEQIKKGEGQFSDVADDDTVSIGKLWVGEKKDIRYVKFEKVGDDIKEKEYSSAEMFRLQDEIAPYCMKEGDEDFNQMVESIAESISDLDAIFTWTLATNEMIRDARNEIAPFDGFAGWLEVSDIVIGKEENEEDYTRRVKPIYEKQKHDVVSKVLSQNKDKVLKKAREIVKMRSVGKLTKNGINRYLADNGAVVLQEDGSYEVITHSDGSIPFHILNHKIGEFMKWNARREFAISNEMSEYPEAK